MKTKFTKTVNGNNDLLALEFDPYYMELHYRRVVVVGDCWLIGNKNRQVHSVLSVDQKRITSSRYALILATKQAPPGMYACHQCRNKHCVNPKHLYWGTPSDNTRDMERDGTANRPHSRNHFRAKITPVIARRIAKLYMQGKLSSAQIARIHNVTTGTVDNIVRKKAWARHTEDIQTVHRSGQGSFVVKGEKHVCARLKSSHVSQIIVLIQHGKTDQYIAGRYNVHRRTIGDIRHFKTWKHISRPD